MHEDDASMGAAACSDTGPPLEPHAVPDTANASAITRRAPTNAGAPLRRTIAAARSRVITGIVTDGHDQPTPFKPDVRDDDDARRTTGGCAETCLPYADGTPRRETAVFG